MKVKGQRVERKRHVLKEDQFPRSKDKIPSRLLTQTDIPNLSNPTFFLQFPFPQTFLHQFIQRSPISSETSLKV